MYSIECVIFDLGHVLVDVDFARGERALAELAGGRAELVEQFSHGDAYRRFMTGELTPTKFHQAFCSAGGLDPSRLPISRFKTAWMAYLVGPVEGMAEILERLAAKRVKLALFSNTDVWHFEACRSFVPALSLISQMRLFASFQLGLAKPDPAAFGEVCRRLALAPEHCLMVDDLPENIKGAESAGLEGVRFTGAGELARAFEALGLL